MNTYHFTTTNGDDLKIHDGDLRAVEYNTKDHREVITLHLKSTGQEYDIDANDKEMLLSLRTLTNN